LRVLRDQTGSPLETIDQTVEPRRLSRYLRGFLYENGDPHDPYRVGPHGPLIGQPVSELPKGAPRGTITTDQWGNYDSVDLKGVLPALFDATVTGVDVDRWVAVAINGKIAGVGPVYRNSLNHVEGTNVMLDPSFLVDGENEIEVFVIDENGLTLHPLERRD
jgi:hypothetical protein